MSELKTYAALITLTRQPVQAVLYYPALPRTIIRTAEHAALLHGIQSRHIVAIRGALARAPLPGHTLPSFTIGLN